MKRILITGGAGFVGSNLAIALKKCPTGLDIVAFDNLYRKGSEINVPRLAASGVGFIRGDVRNSQDLDSAGKFDFLIECSAEPSALAGKDGGTDYLVGTNLYGAVNCAELCRKNNAGMIFISTSRVYPIQPLLDCEIRESEKRFDFADRQKVSGLSARGVAEDFPMSGARSLYGATKYAAEIMLIDYAAAFGIPIIINRCGVIAGPWQFGKSDQGIAVFWMAAHIFRKPLKFIGFEGRGKQVRDFLHIDDLIRLVLLQLENPAEFANAGPLNAGGGRKNSLSLLELTEICAGITGKQLNIGSDPETRYADIPAYITDNSKISGFCGWKPEKNVADIFGDIHSWIQSDQAAQKLLA